MDLVINFNLLFNDFNHMNANLCLAVPSCDSLSPLSNELLSSGCGSIVASPFQDLLSDT